MNELKHCIGIFTNLTNNDASEVSCAQGCQESHGESDGSDRGEEVAEVILDHVCRVLKNLGVCWLGQPLLGDVFYSATHPL